MLNDNLGLQVRWFISGNDIVIHLVGNIEESEYMALGLSKDDTETKFDSADAAVTWLDKDGKGHVVDYFLESPELCVDGHGMCPDDVHEGSGNNFILTNANKFNKTTIITFKRHLKAEDKLHDQNIYTDGPQAVLWAVGSLEDGNLAGSPRLRTRGNLLLDFGRDPNWNCPPLNTELGQLKIHCPGDHLFRAQMGPSTDNNITNVWYMNGLPTPDLIVERGQEYTFIVEGGMGPSIRNPLYITDSGEGGLYQNLLEAIDSTERFYAGVHQDAVNGLYFPTSVIVVPTAARISAADAVKCATAVLRIRQPPRSHPVPGPLEAVPSLDHCSRQFCTVDIFQPRHSAISWKENPPSHSLITRLRSDSMSR
ncbi:hypothetical protein TNCV_497871 [Trichonephila clavipes]|nr:hypothetical protein TNCV_497871 [Trichonephila clavipes]